ALAIELLGVAHRLPLPTEEAPSTLQKGEATCQEDTLILRAQVCREASSVKKRLRSESFTSVGVRRRRTSSASPRGVSESTWRSRPASPRASRRCSSPAISGPDRRKKRPIADRTEVACEQS